MEATKYFNFKPWARKTQLQENAESTGTATYREKLTLKTREEEIQLLVEAARKNQFPKAREHAENLHQGFRNVTGTLYKFLDPAKSEVGYYNEKGCLVQERQMSQIEKSRI